MTEQDILDLIAKDPWMMRVLESAASLNLPDWMIGAGFVRNKIWDHLHGYIKPKVETADIDLIYYDPADLSEGTEKKYDAALAQKFPVDWSTKNMARMYIVNRDEPYVSSADALAHWVETPTCVAVTIREGRLILIAPHGIDDLVNLIVRPSPAFTRDLKIFHDRVSKKKWLEKWPRLKIVL